MSRPTVRLHIPDDWRDETSFVPRARFASLLIAELQAQELPAYEGAPPALNRRSGPVVALEGGATGSDVDAGEMMAAVVMQARGVFAFTRRVQAFVDDYEPPLSERFPLSMAA